MTLLACGFLAIVGIAVYGVLKVARNRVHQHGFLILAWRFLTGHPWHGSEITDAGWLRPGRRALTRTGFAPRFHYRPRWQRTMMRTGTILLLVLVAWSWLVNAQVTQWVIVCLLFISFTFLGWRAWRRLQQRKHRRTWVEPLHTVVAPMVGIPVANAPSSWLAIEPDRSKAVLALPPGQDFSDGKLQDRIVRAAAAKLGIEAPEARWELGGPEPALTISQSQPPPAKVVLADVQKHIDDSGTEVLVIGLGRQVAPVSISLHGDSPHLGLSIGSGGGKSVTARFFAAQQLYKGAIVLVLDIKRISHTWARGLPNVAYARDPEEIHAALMWLQGEVGRRNKVADVAADIEGQVHANVGPRILVVCEEMNATMKQLRSYWRRERESGDAVRSPALDALDEVNFTGRQVRVNLLMIGQRLSAEATGGGDSRESLAALIFARYKPSTWKMLVPDMPMPPATRHVGRVEVVTDAVRQAQVAFLTGREARTLALAGRVTPCPAGMPFAGQPLPATEPQGELAARPDLGNATVSGGHNGHPPVPEIAAEAVTLSAAVEAGLMGSLTLAGVRTARHRDESFPRPVARQGLAHLYDPVELDDWRRSREAVHASR